MTCNTSIDWLSRRLLRPVAALALLLLAADVSLASDAFSSASAGSGGDGSGTASATAGYNGSGRGFAKTRTRSGPVNFAHGISFGIDEHGVSFSASHALASLRGPAVARTMNLSVGFDGRVARSSGSSVASGSPTRLATAAGSAQVGPGAPTARALASGRTGRWGLVKVATRSHTWRHLPYGRRA